jgi:hypothetical protein
MAKLELIDLPEGDCAKPWYKSKTVWFNLATIGVAILTGLSGVLPILSPIVSEVVMAYILFGVGFANVVLRAVTSKPLV